MISSRVPSSPYKVNNVQALVFIKNLLHSTKALNAAMKQVCVLVQPSSYVDWFVWSNGSNYVVIKQI